MSQATTPVPATPIGPRRSSWSLRLIFGLLAAALALSALTVVALVGYTLTRVADAPEAPPAPVADPIARAQPVDLAADPAALVNAVDVWDKHGPVNILLLGLDMDDCAQPEGLTRRTDTIILVRVDPASGKAAMLSIPRDLYVYIDATYGGVPVGAKKITTAHVYGTRFDEQGREVPHSGAELVKDTIRANLGITAHRYVRVDFAGFQQIVDALGGIEVEVQPSAENPSVGLYDDEYPDGHCGTMVVDFPPGRRTLDGAEALQYARSRKSTSDFDRSRRQMDVLLAIRERGTRVGVLLDLPKLIPALRDTIDTDLTPDEVISLANTARGIDPGDVLRLQMDENVTYNDMLVIDGAPQWLLRLRQQAFDALRAQFMDPAQALQAAAAARAEGARAEPGAENGGGGP